MSKKEKPENEDLSYDSIKRLRSGVYRRLRCEVKLNSDSPLTSPDASNTPVFVGDETLDNEPPYNPLLD
jgi:hypothetical protein